MWFINYLIFQIEDDGKLVSDTLILQRRATLRSTAGIEALEEQRMKKMEMLRAQYKEENMLLQQHQQKQSM